MSQSLPKLAYSLDLSFNDNAPDCTELANSSLQYLKINKDNTIQSNSEFPLSLVNKGAPQALRQVLSHFGIEDKNAKNTSNRGSVSKSYESENSVANDIKFSNFEKIQYDSLLNSTGLATIFPNSTKDLESKTKFNTTSSTNQTDRSGKSINKIIHKAKCHNQGKNSMKGRVGFIDTNIDVKNEIEGHHPASIKSTHKQVRPAINSEANKEMNNIFPIEKPKFDWKKETVKQNDSKSNYGSQNIIISSLDECIYKNHKVLSNFKSVNRIRLKKKRKEHISKKIDNLDLGINIRDKEFSFSDDCDKTKGTCKNVSQIEHSPDADSIVQPVNNPSIIPIVFFSNGIIRPSIESNESSLCPSRSKIEKNLKNSEFESIEHAKVIGSADIESSNHTKDCENIMSTDKNYGQLSNRKQISENARAFCSNNSDNEPISTFTHNVESDTENKCSGNLKELSRDLPLKSLDTLANEEFSNNIKKRKSYKFDEKIIEKKEILKTFNNKKIIETQLESNLQLISECKSHQEANFEANSAIEIINPKLDKLKNSKIVEKFFDKNEVDIDKNNASKGRKLSTVNQKMENTPNKSSENEIKFKDVKSPALEKVDNDLPDNDFDMKETKKSLEKETVEMEKKNENVIGEIRKFNKYNKNSEHVRQNFITNICDSLSSKNLKTLEEKIFDKNLCSSVQRNDNTNSSVLKKGSEQANNDNANLDSIRDNSSFEESRIEITDIKNEYSDKLIVEENKSCNIFVTNSESQRNKSFSETTPPKTKNTTKGKILEENKCSSIHIHKSKKTSGNVKHNAPSKAQLIKNLLKEKLNIIEKGTPKLDEQMEKTNNEVISSEIKQFPDLCLSDYKECHGKKRMTKKLCNINDGDLSDISNSLNDKTWKYSNKNKTVGSETEDIFEHSKEKKSISGVTGIELHSLYKNDRNKEEKNVEKDKKNHSRLDESSFVCRVKEINEVTDNWKDEETYSKRKKKSRENKDTKNRDQPTANKIKDYLSNEKYCLDRGRRKNKPKIQLDKHISAILSSKINTFLSNLKSEENKKNKEVVENTATKLCSDKKQKQEVIPKLPNSPTLIDGSFIDSERLNFQEIESFDEKVDLENEYKEMQSYLTSSSQGSSCEKFSKKLNDILPTQNEVKKKHLSVHGSDLIEDSLNDQATTCTGKSNDLLMVGNKNINGTNEKILGNSQKYSPLKTNSKVYQGSTNDKNNHYKTSGEQMTKSTGVNSSINPITEKKLQNSELKRNSQSLDFDHSLGEVVSNQHKSSRETMNKINNSNQITLPNDEKNSESDILYLNDDMILELEGPRIEIPIINSFQLLKLKDNEEVEMNTSTNISNQLIAEENHISLSSVGKSKNASPIKNFSNKNHSPPNEDVDKSRNKIEKFIVNKPKRMTEIDITDIKEHQSENDDDFDEDMSLLSLSDANSCPKSEELSIEKDIRFNSEILDADKSSLVKISKENSSENVSNNLESCQNSALLESKVTQFKQHNSTNVESPNSCITKSVVKLKEKAQTHKETKRKLSEYEENISESNKKKIKSTGKNKKLKCRNIEEYFKKEIKENSLCENKSSIKIGNKNSDSSELKSAIFESSSHRGLNEDNNYEFSKRDEEFSEKSSELEKCKDQENNIYSFADILSQSHAERLEKEFDNIREELSNHQDRKNMKSNENIEINSEDSLFNDDAGPSSMEIEQKSVPKREISEKSIRKISTKRLVQRHLKFESTDEESLQRKKRSKEAIKLIKKSKSIWEIQEKLKINKKRELEEKIKNLQIENPYPLSDIQKIAYYIITPPTYEQKKELDEMGIHLKLGFFSEEEDKKIINNWKDFCERHHWDENEYLPFISSSKAKHGVLPLKQLMVFVQFISHGFQDRTMNSVYLRFIRLISRSEQRDKRFTKYEDKVLKKYVETSNSTKPFADVATILNKKRDALMRRYILLKQRENLECPKVIWKKALLKKLLVVMAEVTCCKNIMELKNYQIAPQEWSKVSEKMKLPVKSIKRSWFLNFYPRLFIEDYFKNLEETYLQLINVLSSRYSHWKEINWEIVAEEMGNELPKAKYNKMFRDLVKNKVPFEIQNNLKECLKFLRTAHLRTRRDNFRYVKDILVETKNGMILPKLEESSESSEEI